ncbi:MAG: hypothetical protein EA412_10615 [Chitinophagaceae bacterium]|nr:MAG: hypothetical protein EA412_10615 [Chitinophagaceae bacterium]
MYQQFFMKFYNAGLLLLFTVVFCFIGGVKQLSAQTIMAPEILCVSTDENTGDVTISWELPTDNCGPFEAYVLYGATNINGPYLVIDTIFDPLQEEYVHLNANATILTWFYYMETLRDCPGFVSLQSDTIQEEELITPEIEYVTVTEDGIEFFWDVSPSTQTEGYIVYYYVGGGFANIIDTVDGRFNNNFIDTTADPNSGSVSYTVATLGCNQTSLFNPSFHSTVYLEAGFQTCETNVALNWTPYEGWDSTFLEYRVLYSSDDIDYDVGGTLTNTEFALPLSLVEGDSVCVFVEAENTQNGFISASNKVCLNLDLVRPVAYQHMRNVTVNENNEVLIEWYQDGQADINSISVNRSDQSTGFSPIFTETVVPPLDPIGTLTDTEVNASQSSYYYTTTVQDDCDNTLNSGFARTIRLQGEAANSQNNLNWNAFEMENAVINQYVVYRLENTLPVQIGTTAPGERTFSEMVEGDDVTESGAFCYVVKAEYTLDIADIAVTENLESRSNIFCIDQESIIYMPNAFVPGGTNNRLVPVITFNRHQSYEFKVFDRWGKVLFQTNNINVGWDGTASGSDLPLGGYAYVVRLVKENGDVYEKKGTVVLVR